MSIKEQIKPSIRGGKWHSKKRVTVTEGYLFTLQENMRGAQQELKETYHSWRDEVKELKRTISDLQSMVG